MKNSNNKDYRLPTDSKWQQPKAAVDAFAGIIIATAEVSTTSEELFKAFTTDKVEQWWQHPNYYRWTDWHADLRVCGKWSVKVVLADGGINGGHGEFAEIQEPYKLVMTRKFDEHPLLDDRVTTLTYYFRPTENGTFVTVKDEGFIGREEAAFGNAEHWERVLSWLQTYFAEEKN
jgi:uncharacterized protein YndB with AHSA1/START domain